jgi:putative transposase
MRGVDRQAVFFQPSDYARFLDALTAAAGQHQCSIHAYVLMTNHVHLLATPSSSDAIPRIMQSLGRQYVQPINRQYHRTGTLWQGRYKTQKSGSNRN